MIALGIQGEKEREQGKGVAGKAACVGGQGFAAAGCPDGKGQGREGKPDNVLQIIGQLKGSLKMLCAAVAAE